MNKFRKIFNEILKEITPTQREIEFINTIADKLKQLLDKKAKKEKVHYTKIEPQGSTGIKQTQLKNDFDIDFFIGLDYNQYKHKYEGLSKNKLKQESKKDFLSLCNNWIFPSLILEEFHNPRLLYAEHPYVTVDYILNDFKVKIDIVLYFDLELEYIKKHGPITAVDRSPWHGYFVRDNLTPHQKNDVRLLKQFFKACHSYGDKSVVGKVGFIGYSAELLIYYFNDILNLFKNFKTLSQKPLDYYNRTKKELEEIVHFQNDSLIIIDPIDQNRNVASAISERAYKYCNQKVSEFLEHPDTQFFKIHPISEADLSDKDNQLLSQIFIIELYNTKKKIHYTINRDKLYSLGESIKTHGEKEYTHLERFGQIIFELYFEEDIDQYNLAIYCEKPIISKSYIRQGPPVTETIHVEKFKKKNPTFFEKEGYLWVETFRKYINFLNFLNKFIKKHLPENFKIINCSTAFNTRTYSGKKAISILKNYVLPFYV
jgi:tRNA CCA-adding enzyme